MLQSFSHAEMLWFTVYRAVHFAPEIVSANLISTDRGFGGKNNDSYMPSSDVRELSL